ncbi:MAG: hypothetical protein APF76_12175 [Desulfitibacter sp. BRH_c19]|nr:MAG: hypothetical protein APF76_12175 [Desulfitibacter sp. BRH_c19]
MFGGIGDVITVVLLTNLNLVKFKNMGVFSAFDYFSICTPLTWMLAFMIFFYFLPVRKVFLLPYIIGFSLLSFTIGHVKAHTKNFINISLILLVGVGIHIAYFNDIEGGNEHMM